MIPALRRQTKEDPWGSLASQSHLIGSSKPMRGPVSRCIVFLRMTLKTVSEYLHIQTHSQTDRQADRQTDTQY